MAMPWQSRSVDSSPYHLEAAGSLRVADTGQQVQAGWTPLARASAVAALSCCTKPVDAYVSTG